MNFYAPNTARFDNPLAMTEDQMRAVAPSIFATTAHESRSDRFQPIPTIDVVRALVAEGFSPVGAVQSKARDESKTDYTKHLVRFRRLDDATEYKVGDNVMEIILKNGNDGSSAYEIMSGMFRIRCLNSLVTMSSEINSTKVRHTGDVQGKVIDGTYEVLETAKLALNAAESWSNIELDEGQRHRFGQAVRIVRFGDDDGIVPADCPYDVQKLLAPRRRGDTGTDLWTTLNVCQENAIRGGLHGVKRDTKGNYRRTSTRQVKGIDQSVKLNRAIWTLGERMAELAA